MKGIKLTSAQRRLVESVQTQRLVRFHVRTMCRQWPGADEGELYACAQEALVSAARRYEVSRGVSFVTYATKWVHGRMLRHISREWLHRHPAAHILNAPSMAHRDDPDAPCDEQRAQLAQDVENHYFMDMVLHALHGQEPPSPETAAIYRQARRKTKRAFRALPVDHNTLLQRHYEQGAPLKQLAIEWGVSENTVKRRHQQALSILKHALLKMGISSADLGPEILAILVI